MTQNHDLSRVHAAGLLLAGDERPGVVPADIIFVVDEKNHATYRRDGSDLLYSTRMSLVDALCGTTLSIPHLDGTTLAVPVLDIITPTATKILR